MGTATDATCGSRDGMCVNHRSCNQNGGCMLRAITDSEDGDSGGSSSQRPLALPKKGAGSRRKGSLKKESPGTFGPEGPCGDLLVRLGSLSSATCLILSHDPPFVSAHAAVGDLQRILIEAVDLDKIADCCLKGLKMGAKYCSSCGERLADIEESRRQEISGILEFLSELMDNEGEDAWIQDDEMYKLLTREGWRSGPLSGTGLAVVNGLGDLLLGDERKLQITVVYPPLATAPPPQEVTDVS